jgi:uncharacterized membrane protein YsdA (DUF1294 family)
MRLPREGIGYFLGAAAVAVAVLILVETQTTWPFYGAWLAGLSAGAFVVYGADKLAAVAGRRRAPEILLHALAVLGGCAGAWAGMFLFRHKSNYRKHPDIWLVLILSTVGHALLAYFLLVRG